MSRRQRILFAGMSRILVAEDDADIAALIRHYLEKAGFTVDLTESGRDVLPRLRRSPVDAVILDVMLPGMDGFDVCRAMRADPTTAAVPVIMLTAKAEESDRIVGLELGADDYITKPFSPGRSGGPGAGAAAPQHIAAAPPSGTLTYGPLSLDADRHVVTVDGQDVRLTAKEFLLLQYLLQHRGRVLSRDLLLSDVWDYAYTGGTRTVDVHVRRLREKLPFLTEALVTVKQFGYKLLDPPPPGAPTRRG